MKTSNLPFTMKRLLAVLSILLGSAVSAFSQCQPDDRTLCLLGGRFQAQVQWTDFQNNTGSGHVVRRAVSDASGNFWFFGSDNWELLLKVLDGCAVNNNTWVFGAASTNVQYTITVTDTQTGFFVQYTNPLGTASSAITDTSAFPCSANLTQNTDTTGTWNALVTLMDGTQTNAIFTFFQPGALFSGTYFTDSCDGGTFGGDIAGQAGSILFGTQVKHCPGTFNGSITVSPTNQDMTGTLSGSNCDGAYTSSFTATKQ